MYARMQRAMGGPRPFDHLLAMLRCSPPSRVFALFDRHKAGVALLPIPQALPAGAGYVACPGMGGRSMSKKGITGHDEWVVTESLATALIALEQLEPKHQPVKHMDDIRKLLVAGCQPGTVNLHLAQAKCRLFPGADRASIYREYGLEDTEV